MKTFTVTIDTGNAAYDPDPAPELVHNLRIIAERIGFTGKTSGVIHDTNGSRVGFYELEA